MCDEIDINVFSSRVKNLAESKRITLSALAKSVGISYLMLWRSMKGERNLKTEELLEIAKQLETSPLYLLGEVNDPARNYYDGTTLHNGSVTYSGIRRRGLDGPEESRMYEAAAKAKREREAAELSNVRGANLADFIRVRVLDKAFTGCCGKGFEWLDTAEFEKTLLLPLPDLARRYGDDDVLGMYAEGDSMEPIICDGDLVLFVPRDQHVAYAGIPMVVSYNSAILMRGVIVNNNGTILRAKSDEYKDIFIEEWDDFDIRGRIVKIFSTRDPRSVL